MIKRRLPQFSRKNDQPVWYVRIATRILALNILLLLVPVLALGFFREYEQRLLDAQEHAMTQQGRFLAAWLSETSVGMDLLDRAAARRTLAALQQRHTARFRIIAADYSLLADSSALLAVSDADSLQPSAQASLRIGADRPVSATLLDPAAERTWLYRVMSWPIRWWRRYVAPPQTPLEAADFYEDRLLLDGPEVQAALAGRYGSTTRYSPAGQTSVTLYTALPIRQSDRVLGAVLVSQSTYRILRNLYSLRLAAGRIFLWGLLLAVAGTFVLSFTITRPLSSLARLARASARPDGSVSLLRLKAGKRPDEIGDLQRSLALYAQALQERANRAEGFASDVAHELKNPIASALASLEVLETVPAGPQRDRFMASVRSELERMRAVLDSLRLLAVVEAASDKLPPEPTESHLAKPELAAAEVVAVGSFLESFLGNAEAKLSRPISFSLSGLDRETEPLLVAMPGAMLEIAVGNLLDNAVGFCPDGGRVAFCCRRSPPVSGQAWLEILIADDGPGVPPEHAEQIFNRFFTWRPAIDRRSHSGLGLSIARAIVRAGGGSLALLTAFETKHLPADWPAGACFVLRLPLYRA